MKADYCPTANEPCQSMCDTPCSRHRLNIAPPQASHLAQQKQPAEVWSEGYQQGVEDERTSEANIGIAGFGAKVKPARQNPYGSLPPAPLGQQEPVAWMRPSEHGYDSVFRDHSTLVACHGNPWTGWVPLYTTPPQTSQPLTDEWIRERCAQTWIFETAKQWVRMTEQAHGIGAAKKGQL